MSTLALNGSQTAATEDTNGSDFSISQQIGDLVELTDVAAEEINARLAIADFDRRVVVRISLESDRSERVTIAFDYPVADGRDWLGQSKGVPIVIDKKFAHRLRDRTIDYSDEGFLLH